MAQLSQLSQHIESFVNLSSSPAHQAASLDAIVSLLKNNVLTIEKLVIEMDMYLTTTDDVTRARGMLLLGEVLSKLASKPLDDATIHSLIVFFSDRLADWKALRGALVGCLALVSRKSSGDVVTANDAKAVARSYLQNLQVQSLAQHDRKLCFELLEGLLQRFPDAIASLGEDLLYGICEAIDGEKDPQCLMLTFCIVEVVVRVFPDDLLASFASDLFEILGCYFPIHFTHSMGEDFDVKRDDLSTALMRAFSSTPLFAPFAIPLLLEKLSSSLPSAKVDSLKYLSSCTLTYGADCIAKHAGAIWSSIKDVIYFSLEHTLSFGLESLDGPGFQENAILQEALTLLQIVIKQNTDLFLSQIIADEDINFILKSISNFNSYNKIPMQSKQKLHAVGCILSVSVKASLSSCIRVIESFFPTLVNALGLSVRNLPQDCFPSDNYVFAERLNHAALYLCIELIAACRDVVSGSEQFMTESGFAHEKWCCLIQSFSVSLTKAFTFTLAKSAKEDAYDADAYFGVKGLLILGTFPGGFFTISKSIFEDILLTLTSIITLDFEKTLLWKLALKALVYIGVSVDRCHESEKKLSYMGIVIDKIVSLASFHDFSMPLPLKLEAISEIGASGANYLLKIVQGLEEAIFDNLSEISIHGNSQSAEIVVQLLECYSDKVFPRIHETGSFEEVSLRFALNIWGLLENCVAFSVQAHENGLLDATMKAMKLAIASCSVETQTIIVQRAYNVLSSGTSFPLKEPMVAIPIQLKGLQLTQEIDIGSSRDEWIYSLFASVIIALRPQTHIPNVRLVLQLFMTTMLKGNVPAAQALGSMVNKFVLNTNVIDVSSTCTLEEAMDIIFNMSLCSFDDIASSRIYGRMNNGGEMCLNSICRGVVNGRSLQIHAVTGLAWIGKGLLMRGHEKVKDITMILLECLLSNDQKGPLPVEQDSSEDSSKQGVHPSVMKCAADAFQILMTDSENCLCRKFHATIRPLYKQRFYSTIMPILQSLIMKSESSFSRSMLCRACAYIISDTPVVVILNEAKKVIPILMEGLSVLCNDVLDKQILYSLVLVLSGILTEKNGQEAILECAHIIINHLIGLISYSHMMLVRETAIQCLIAMSSLPQARIYPMRVQVLKAISKALDDPKRAVRQEAVRCQHAWAPVVSRNLQF
ncbi:MMS19 nucleotide excision repair protein homolog isoform X1 [Mangifera indica]|uniref:MMS19 nucleotide excision repair protein homolog isoform X1 n=2 Tax=Mangifera indica TaxID=29780 RepID=UPI001CF93A36|nr:MMS19 nucleotide excision repair protein homolog isoform X1 [Mangifera indica]